MSRSVSLCAAALVVFGSVAVPLAGAKGPTVIIKLEDTDAKVDAKVELGTKPPFEGKRPTVDVAILLDTSNSMDGLINQAKSQLWTIVQQFAKAKKAGQTPALRVALFEYGNMGLPASEGYIRQVVPLGDDLDKLSEALFALKTNGGDEYCGQVIDVAVKSLDWSKEPNGYKAIFIAGNEPFTQGPVKYQDACKLAIERGIVVNTIHCGNGDEGRSGMWQDGARLAEGESFNIDQDRAVVQIKCPQDAILIQLNAELNKTYLWYGAASERRMYCANQMAQDSNAAQLGTSVIAARSRAKASSGYQNYHRDLVDTLSVEKEVLTRVATEELPAEMQDMKSDEREAYVKKMAARRAELQAEIGKLSLVRDAYIEKEQAVTASAAGAPSTLGDVMVTAIDKQMAEAGFEQAGGGEVNRQK
jgi:hypothetical protein